MNYWPSGSANLLECQLPLFDAMKELAAAGAVTAKEHYNAGGWVLHHNFDLWRGTAPINASNHGIWQTGGAWLSTHLWEHYLYTLDKQFLRETAYPLMKGAAQFFVDAMVKDPKTGRLITGPSNSPEQGGLVMGPTMDHQIVRSLFGEVIAAAKTLGVDAELRAKLDGMRKQIAPNQIGKHGQLQEWLEDKDDPKNQHRHQSHLWGVHPGYEITRVRDAGSVQGGAAVADLSRGRGDGLVDGVEAEFVGAVPGRRPRVQDSAEPDHAGVGRTSGEGGAVHEPVRRASAVPDRRQFRGDGGDRGDAAAEPRPVRDADELDGGAVGRGGVRASAAGAAVGVPIGEGHGIAGAGGLTVDVEWKDGKLVGATLTAGSAIPVKVRYAGKEREVQLKAGEVYRVGAGL